MSITKGDWEVRNNTGGDSDYFVASPQHSRWAIAVKISKDDAALIAEAGTVHNETGCTPRELLEQRDKLLDACKDVRLELDLLFGLAEQEVSELFRAAKIAAVSERKEQIDKAIAAATN